MDQVQKINYINYKGPIQVDPFKENLIVCYYFSASWCGPCKQFTPILADFYNEINSQQKQLEIIFASRDQSQTDFDDYFKQMPWIAFPFSDPKIAELKQKYNITSIPTLVVLKQNGEILKQNGRSDVQIQGVNVFDKWIAKL